jgi:two-component system, cell cycle response regulator
MSQAHKISLVGFSAFERATFESFFRLAARRPPGYVLVAEPAQADLAVVNADDAAVLRQCIAAKPCKHVMLIGNQDGGTGWPIQKRPLNLMKVLATVESTLGGGAAASAATAPTSSSPAITSAPAPALARALQAAQPGSASSATTATTGAQFAGQASASASAAPRLASGVSSDRALRSVRTGSGAAADFTASRAGVLSGATKPATLDSQMDVDHILVVDDSDIALKFMRNRLSRFGFLADLVNSGEEALGRLNAKPYKFVFLDVMMEGLDGYQTCRAIKQRKYAEGKPPVVVMLTSRGGTIDKIRGTLAGCDAYLTKPLNERDLIAVLAKHDRNVARGFQETNFGAGGGKSDFGVSSKS